MPIKVLNSIFLTPTAQPVIKVRCDADVNMNSDYGNQWREHMVKEGAGRYAGNSRVAQCTFNAVVEIDGTPMCRRHAGQVVLAKWINGELTEKEIEDAGNQDAEGKTAHEGGSA